MNRTETSSVPFHEQKSISVAGVLDKKQSERGKWLETLTAGNYLFGFGFGGLLGLDTGRDKSFFLGASITALALGALFISAPYLDRLITKKINEQKKGSY